MDNIRNHGMVRMSGVEGEDDDPLSVREAEDQERGRVLVQQRADRQRDEFHMARQVDIGIHYYVQ